MSVKSNTAPETQAKQIINDPNKYDADTRDKIAVCLSNLNFHRSEASNAQDAKKDERELRRLIQKAEAGEPIFNVDQIGAEYVAAARIVYEVITKPNHIPEFVYEAVKVALDEAQRQTKCKLWFLPHGCEDTLENYGYSIQRMAQLFKYSSRADIKVVPKKELAGMIIDVLEHPDCPPEIRDAVNGATSELFNRLNDDERKVYFTAPYIHALIVESKLQEGGTQ